jgi:hypothetical protein
VNKRYTFDLSAVGWQALETRGRVILETKEFGLVARGADLLSQSAASEGIFKLTSVLHLMASVSDATLGILHRGHYDRVG